MRRAALGGGAALLLLGTALAFTGVPAPPTIAMSGGERIAWRTAGGLVRTMGRFATDLQHQPLGWMHSGEGILVRTSGPFGSSLGTLTGPNGSARTSEYLPPHATSSRFRPNAGDGSFAYGLDDGGSEKRRLYWYDGATGTSTPLTRTPAALSVCCFDPAGRRLAFSSDARNGSDSDIYVWEQGRSELVHQGEGR